MSPTNLLARSPRPDRRAVALSRRRDVPPDLLKDAGDVFGSLSEARAWFETPAIGLRQRRPIELIGTRLGREQIVALLAQIRHGVYV